MAQSTYLERRVLHFADLAKQGKIHLPAEGFVGGRSVSEILDELEKVRRGPDGRVDLKTCSPIVRTLARTIYTLREEPTKSTEATIREESAPPFDLAKAQRELFTVLRAILEEATGKKLDDLRSKGDLIEATGRRVTKKTLRANALNDLASDYLRISASTFTRTYSYIGGLGGFKTVLGGNQRFPGAALAAVRSMLLYADTILIPDPVLPWFEIERKEERFAFGHMIEQVFELLKLKPFIDADLPYPAIAVFPSFEKQLELSEPGTQDGLALLFMEFFSWYLDATFEDESEIMEFAGTRPEQFFDSVEKHGLFVAPGESPDRRLEEAIQSYKEGIKKWRSPEFQRVALAQPDSVLVVNGIMEQLTPQFHLRDNADSLRSRPLLWHETHWHYFRLCADASQGQLVDNEILASPHATSLEGLVSDELSWLGSVPLPALLELRRRNENERFRKRLAEFTGQLSSSSLLELDRSVGELKRGLQSLLAEHRNEVLRLEHKYAPHYKALALGSWLTLGAQFLPWLAPFLGPVFPTLAGGVYLTTKLRERAERYEVSRSLTGVLAAAHSKAATRG